MDPLKKAGSPTGQELFGRFSKASDGFPVDAVVDAASNTLLNALRQAHGTRRDAERAFDELAGKLKGLLLDRHYDPVTEKRRNIFPFPQIIEMPLMSLKDVRVGRRR